MFSKTLFVVAFAAIAQFATAANPGCLLGAVNTYTNPGDIKSVCKDSKAPATIAKFCGSQTSDALSAFADICNDKGVKVSTNIATATTGSVSATGTGVYATGTGATTLQTASPTGGNNVTGTGSPTVSGTGAPAGTGAAGRREVAGAAILFGLVAAVL